MLATVAVAEKPTAAAVNQTTGRVYVVSQGSSTASPGTLTVISGADNSVVATVTVGNNPSDVVVDPLANKIYVVNNGSSTVSVVDGATNSVTATISSGNVLHGAIDAGRSRLYIATSSSLRVYDTNTNAQVASVAGDFYSVAVNTATNRVYAGTSIDSTAVRVYDGANLTGGALATIPVSGTADIAVNETTGRVYVSGGTNGSVAVIDGSTNTVVATITLATSASGTEGLSVDASRSRLYVAHESASKLAIIDTATNDVLTQLTVGTFPQDAAVNTATDRVYVPNFSSNSVSVVGPPSLPDLVVTSFSAPSTVTPGGTANYTWTITNQGDATAVADLTDPPPYSWGDQVWLSTSSTSVTGARGAGGIIAMRSLAPGESYTRTFSATIPSDTPPGNYYFILQTDSSSQIGESNENNNLSVAVPVTVTTTATATVSLTAEVRDDRDRDGVVDAGEPLLTAPRLEIFRHVGDSLVSVASAVNSPNITVSGIEEGTFTIVETDPTGYYSTTPNRVTVTVAAGGAAFHVFLDAAARRVAYVYSTDTAARGVFIEKLAPEYAVDAILQSAVAATDLSPYHAIVIGRETGSLATWGSPEAVAHIVRSGKKVLGVGEGGYAFFGRKHDGAPDTIGYGNGWHGSGQAGVTVVDRSDPVWASLDVATAGTATLYGAPSAFVAIYYPTAVAGITPVGRQLGDATHYTLIRQGCDFLWGFDGSPADLTVLGLQAFKNVLATDCVPFRGRVAYVYSTDTAARDAWASMLTARGWVVDAILKDSVQGTDFTRYQAILIGHDTGNGGRTQWGVRAQMDKIALAGKKIVGLGDGGSQFFDTKAGGHSAIGWLQSMYSDDAAVVVVNGADPAWTTPNGIGATTGQTLALYTASNTVLTLYAPASVTGVTRIGREPDRTDHYPLASDGCDVHWGFTASAATLTTVGKLVFENVIQPCAPVARGITGTAEYRETADGTTTTSTLLPGATVTLIDPTGARLRTTASATGGYTFASAAPNTTYVVGYDGTAGGRHYVTGVRFTTDPTGSAVVPQPGAVFNRKNHTWLTAFELADGVAVEDQVWRRGQATWYRVPIQPYMQVTIELTGCGFNCDLVVYRDLKQVAAKLTADAATQPGVRLSLQGDIMADDLDADDLDADDLDADDLDADDLDADDLDADDLDADDLDADDLDADDLDADDLDADDLDADDLDADGDGLTGYGPTYVEAQRKGLRAASLTPGLAPETVVLNTRELSGFLYVRVAGGSSLTDTFNIVARRTQDPACTAAPLVRRAPSTNAASLPTGKSTLVLTDTAAYGLTGTAQAAFLAKLGEFAAHPTVNGHVLDLAGDANVQQLRADWLSVGGTTCVAQANLMTDAVKQVVSMFRAQNPMEYLVNVGGDRVIPFRRVTDRAEISRESRYNPPVEPATPSEASLIWETYLNDDFYVSSAVEGPNRTLFLPDMAVGRLVESVDDVVAYIDTYLASNGQASPTTALSSGYNFAIDLANEVTSQLSASGLTVDASLVSDTWTAADWRAKVLGTAPTDAFGILSLQGHFTANRLVPAKVENGQRVLATEIASVTDGRFRNALVLSLGCHSGYSIVNADATILTQPLAFPEAFVRQGATGVMGTGYQYGETVLVKNSELLIALLTQELGYAAAPDGSSFATGVPIGKALMYAKHAYMGHNATPRGIDLKVVGVSTVYGSPTMRYKLPTTQARPAPVVVAPTPTALPGLSTLDLGPAYTLQQQSAADGQYYTANGDATTVPYRPIAPVVTVGANAPGSVLQGAVFLGGSYSEAPFTPQLSIPTTESAGEAPRYANDVFVPVLPVRTNLFSGDAVQVIPFQYRSNALGTSGTARTYSNVNVRAYWSARTGAAAIAGAPVIRDVSVKLNDAGQLVVLATVRGVSDPGIAEVFVTYTDTSAAAREFRSLAMALQSTQPDGTGFSGFTSVYQATVPGNASAIRFLVQAVSGTGRVAQATANGQLYRLPTATQDIDVRPASAVTLTAPTSVQYRGSLTASATLTSEGAPLAGRAVQFQLANGAAHTALTDASGVASVTLGVDVPPGQRVLTAAYPGDADAKGSGAARTISVQRAQTAFAAAPGQVAYSDSRAIATLTAGGLTLNEQPVVLSAAGQQVATTTDFAGRVRFDTLDFGAALGSRDVTISFAGNARYAPSSTTVSVDVVAENATLVLDALAPQPTGSVTLSAQMTQEADGAPGNVTLASVEFTLMPETGTPIVLTAPVGADGRASASSVLPAGLYTVTARLLGPFAGEASQVLVVFDPSVSVTGGGSVIADTSSIGVPAGLRTNFGFTAKYLPDGVTPQGSATVQFGESGKGRTPITVKSTSYEWLVIAGNGAAFQGDATVDGVSGFKFRIDVVDDTSDVFAVRVWSPAAGESMSSPRYLVSGTLSGGNVRIHR